MSCCDWEALCLGDSFVETQRWIFLGAQAASFAKRNDAGIENARKLWVAVIFATRSTRERVYSDFSMLLRHDGFAAPRRGQMH